MSTTQRPQLFRLVFPAAVLAGLVCPAAGQSGPKAAAAKEQEAVTLKNAYVLMAIADHDYDGHRVKAMHEVEEAIKRIDHTLMKDGGKGNQVVVTEDEIATAKAAFKAKHEGKHHEGQGHSDVELREARELLVKVHETLGASKKHPKAHDHVAKAIKDLDVALKIR